MPSISNSYAAQEQAHTRCWEHLGWQDQPYHGISPLVRHHIIRETAPKLDASDESSGKPKAVPLDNTSVEARNNTASMGPSGETAGATSAAASFVPPPPTGIYALTGQIPFDTTTPMPPFQFGNTGTQPFVSLSTNNNGTMPPFQFGCGNNEELPDKAPKLDASDESSGKPKAVPLDNTSVEARNNTASMGPSGETAGATSAAASFVPPPPTGIYALTGQIPFDTTTSMPPFQFGNTGTQQFVSLSTNNNGTMPPFQFGCGNNEELQDEAEELQDEAEELQDEAEEVDPVPRPQLEPRRRSRRNLQLGPEIDRQDNPDDYARSQARRW